MNSNLLKSPVFGSVVAMIIVFAVILFILWLVKPGFVTTKVQGKKVIRWKRIVAYSAMGALVVGVIVVLWMTDNKKKKQAQVVPVATSRFQKYWQTKAYRV
jgi:hypothetical protein